MMRNVMRNATKKNNLTVSRDAILGFIFIVFNL